MAIRPEVPGDSQHAQEQHTCRIRVYIGQMVEACHSLTRTADKAVQSDLVNTIARNLVPHIHKYAITK